MKLYRESGMSRTRAARDIGGSRHDASHLGKTSRRSF
ncbi:MAG: hypothetical protein KAI47_04710 [Deltaproteobacteria bacterium]|nr:hypothetical protein [Deltaproteobacteria bacterium]